MSYLNFIKINSVTGEIIAKGVAPAEMVSIQKNSPTEEVFVVTEDQMMSLTYDRYYYNGNSFVLRSYSPITKSGPMSFSNIPYGLPAGVKMILESVEYNITESTVDLDIDLPGTYEVVFKNFPYLDAIFEVVV